MDKQIDQVKRKLWTFGYSCKGVSGVPGLDYDLLVDRKYQVKVISKGMDFQSVPKRIIVAEVNGDDITYHLSKSGVDYHEDSPLKAFPKK